MGDTPTQDKKPMENGLSNESEDSGNTSEQEPCLPDTKGKEMDMTDTLDSKHLDTEILKQNKKRHNVNKKPHVSLWATISNTFTASVKYLMEKTGLSKLGVAIATIVLLLLIVCCIMLLVLGILWPKIPHELRFPICRRSACLRSSSEILPRMNPNVSACEDFREFACGRWLQKNPLPADRSVWSLKRHLEFKTRERIRQLILTQPHPTAISSFAWKTKYFYESCMAIDSIESTKEVMLISHISSMGGWYVLRDFQMQTFHPSEPFIRLHADFGVPFFFQVNVVPDPQSPQDYIIQIMPPDLGLPDKSYYYKAHNSMPVVTYKRYLKDVVQLLGATSSDAATFSEDMFNFEKRLAEIIPDARDLQPLQAANKNTVGELKNLAPSIPLLDVLSTKYPEANIDDMTEILIPSPDYLQKISYLISTTDLAALNNYMMWKLTDSFLPYLSEKFRETVAVYRRDLLGERQPLQRWEMCIETMQRFMGFGLAVLLQNHTEDFGRDFNVAHEMFNDIKRETKLSVQQAGWLPQELQEHIDGKLKTMELEVGFPTGGTLLSDLNLEDTYREMFILNRNFFQNIKYGITFLQKQQQLRLKKFDEFYRWMDAASDFDLQVHYVAAANKVVIPQALLQEPYFHPDYPLAVLYGGLGVEMAAAMEQAITPWDVLYADDGTLVDGQHPAVNQSSLAFLHPVTCLRQWWGKEGFASPSASNLTTYNTLVKLSAIKIAFRTLQNQLKYFPHTHQPALENFEDGHLFFITFAQSVCSVKSPQQKDLDSTLDTSLSDKSLLSVVLSQVKDFSRLFSCSKGNIFYTAIPCEDVL